MLTNLVWYADAQYPILTISITSTRRAHDHRLFAPPAILAHADCHAAQTLDQLHLERALKRNTHNGFYAVATTSARQRLRQGKPAKQLHTYCVIFGVVHLFLTERWSPEQIVLTLSSIYPKVAFPQINNRPRKSLGARPPLAVYTELLHNSQQNSTLIHYSLQRCTSLLSPPLEYTAI